MAKYNMPISIIKSIVTRKA